MREKTKPEREFQAGLIREIKSMLPGAIVLKTDPNYIQGIPDLLVLYGKRWAGLECKREEYARHRPNQDYYVELMDGMSFASFIYPGNCGEVLHELCQALRP